MRILLTNYALDERAGTQLFVRDLALALLARGHEPIAYSRRLGDVASELRRATVPVIDDLETLTRPPDLIHGQHHLETMTALARFPNTPAIYVCHGWLPAEEAPPRHPRIVHYVAVDELVRQRLVDECNLDDRDISVLLNFVDLARFRRRGRLAEAPTRALVLSNQASESNYVPTLRRACERLGLALDTVGREAGGASAAPESLLGDYDVVFAKGRTALEAAAVGAAVVLCDLSGLGPMVTTDRLDELRAYNFGVRLLRRAITVDGVVEQLQRYDAADAGAVSRHLRETAGLDVAVERWVELYSRAIETAGNRPTDAGAEALAMAHYLRWGPLTAGDFFQSERLRYEVELDRGVTWAQDLSGQLADARQAHDQASALYQAAVRAAEQAEVARTDAEASHARDRERWRQEIDRVNGQLDATQNELDWIQGSATWRWRRRLLRLGSAGRWLTKLRQRPIKPS